MDVWLKLTMYDFVYVFDAWRKRSCGVVCVWLRTNSDTIVGMFILFYHQEWMIYGGKLIWCDLLTSKIYQFEVTVLVSVRIFVNKLNTYRLKKMMMRTTCKAVNCYSNVARVKYLIGTSNLHLHLLLFTLVNSVEISHQPTRAQSEKTIWRVEIILRSIFIKKFADAEIFER